MSATRPPTQDFGIVMILLFFFAALVFAALSNGCGPPLVREANVEPFSAQPDGAVTLWCIAASARDDGEPLLACSGTLETCYEMRIEAIRWSGPMVSEIGKCVEAQISR